MNYIENSYKSGNSRKMGKGDTHEFSKEYMRMANKHILEIL